MKASVLLNAAAGLRPRQVQAEVVRVRELFAALEVEANVRLVAGPGLLAAAREAAASHTDVVVMAGGDGTMSAGAGGLAGTGKPMGVLPLGTLNHFARDLGIPTLLEEAVRNVAEGIVREVDVGEANDRVFVNNSSLGLYPAAVALRDAWMTRQGMQKWAAMGRAALDTLRRFPVVRLTLLFSLGKRPMLDEGDLWVYLARDAGRFRFLRLALRALIGRLDDSRDFQGLCVKEMLVEDRRRMLRVAFDGELSHVAPPLRYQIRPRALRVIVPRE